MTKSVNTIEMYPSPPNQEKRSALLNPTNLTASKR